MFHSLSKFCENLAVALIGPSIRLPDNIAKSISYESRFSAAGLPFCALTMFVEVLVRRLENEARRLGNA